ncbi:MAG: 3-oxoacyl-ACP reductase FabG [Lachnospiraceae bacterium]|nr:3-oxoacyl-ACP reductase FabG [Lachnospiraceae bacterium]
MEVFNAKNVLVTGASHGIGRATAKAFAKAGCNVAVCCLKDKDALLELKKEIEAEGVKCLTFFGDISSSSFVNDMFKSIANDFKKLDVLINNAGISYVGLLTDMTDEDWKTSVDTNLSSVFYTCRAAIPLMLKEKSGHIINISSIWGVAGASCEVAYSATKGGINAFTQGLAKELAPSGISVNALACGVIDTRMNGHLSKEEKAELAEEIPAGRFGSPEEVADTLVNLTNTTTYLTGQIIRLDGGFI